MDVPARPLTEVRWLMFLSAWEMGWRTAFLPSLEAFFCSSGGVGQKKQCKGTKIKELGLMETSVKSWNLDFFCLDCSKHT